MRLLSPYRSGIASAFGAAVFFGASVPFAKLLISTVPPVLLAGLLYLGSGLGLLAWWAFKHLRAEHGKREAALTRRELPWLAGAILAGGIFGPVLLMLGLAHTSAASASLLLNLEGVFTVGLAWIVFREHFDRRIAFGMALIVAGGFFLTWSGALGWKASLWTLAIVGACLCWAIDNNLTRRISAGDPVQIAGVKGLVAGLVNTGIALVLGHSFPSGGAVAAAGVVGALGYGVSLVLFVVALRHLGTGRAGAYFSTAPFIGAAISLLWLPESPTWSFWVAAALMAGGVGLHLIEHHEHLHAHEPFGHAHRHVHDEHHQHPHDPPWDDTEPHTHFHMTVPQTHSHPHYPDIHHRHRHQRRPKKRGRKK